MKHEIEQDRISEVIEEMCADYCMWPVNATSDETLKLHCEECPLNNIICDEYWDRRERDDG